jgi:uncharacterized protein (DUF924 family)
MRDEEMKRDSIQIEHKNDNDLEGRDNYLMMCNDHLDTLEKFGRYPHRNKVLGRENTLEEIK